MRNDGSAFKASMEKNIATEAAAKGLHAAMTDLSIEIVQKPVETQTDAEKAFVKAFLRIMIMGLIESDGPFGGSTI